MPKVFPVPARPIKGKPGPAGLPARLQCIRLMRHLTQQALATRCKMTQARIGHFECGISTPHLNNLYTLARELNVSADYLIGLEYRDLPKPAKIAKPKPSVAAPKRKRRRPWWHGEELTCIKCGKVTVLNFDSIEPEHNMGHVGKGEYSWDCECGTRHRVWDDKKPAGARIKAAQEDLKRTVRLWP